MEELGSGSVQIITAPDPGGQKFADPAQEHCFKLVLFSGWDAERHAATCRTARDS